MEGCIVAVADVFDALTSDSMYRQALPLHDGHLFGSAAADLARNSDVPLLLAGPQSQPTG